MDFSNKKVKNSLFVIVFIMFGWIAYAPMTTNFLSNPDGIYLGIINRDGDGSAAFGRIGVGAVIKLMYSVVSPNLMMIIALFILGIAICLIADAFDVDSFVGIGVLGGILLLSPAMSSQLTYYYCMVQYLLAYLLGACAFYLIAKHDSWITVVIASVAICIQLTLYQAFLSVTCALGAFYLLKLVLTNTDIKKVLVKMLKFIIAAVAGVLSYVSLLKVLHVELADTRGFDKLGQIDIILRIKLVKYAYVYFIDFMFGNDYINNSWMHRDYVNIFVLAAFLVLLTMIVVKNKLYKKMSSLLLIIVYVLALPVCYELMVIMAPEVDIHGTTGIIMVPAMSIYYMGIVFIWKVLFNKPDRKFKHEWVRSLLYKNGYAIVLAPIIYCFVLFTVVFQNVMWLNYQSTYSLCQKMSYKIDEFGGREERVQVTFMGKINDGKYPFNHQEIRDVVRGTLAEYGQIWEGGSIANHCYKAFYNNYFGINYNIVSNEIYNQIALSDSFADMPIFPEAGSVVRDGDVIIVKISEVN
ncbi:glucosyltransferase domain-containing protein [Butyrivibrio sp. INlla14]|uniref:glucosyltransferase domain-containing protein n=1 Tax=Butyrivibrio sp. INlla14 TaxID=1520808 RepID=UPI0015A0C12E|nr:glucosyltransferase domain-containing protein [Butyrivibrio sp. INlla14]